jgi:hypothetical protein
MALIYFMYILDEILIYSKCIYLYKTLLISIVASHIGSQIKFFLEISNLQMKSPKYNQIYKNA